MLTVIIAEKHIIEQHEKFKILLSPFGSEDIVFCEWNRNGNNLDEMLPNLHELISFRKNWRAIIVSEDGKEKINPYDYVASLGCTYSLETGSNYADFIARCKKNMECYEIAVKNPLTKLSVALCESPLFADVLDADNFDEIMSQKKTMQEYMLAKKLEVADTLKIVSNIKKYRLEQLRYFVSEGEQEEFLLAFEEKRLSDMLALMSENKITDFIDFTGIGDKASFDMGYWMCFLENTKKAQLFKILKADYKLRTELPQEVICVSPRICDTRIHNSKMAWVDKSEENYSNFSQYNMYNGNISFLVYDMLPDDCSDSCAQLFKFHTLLQILALHGDSASTIIGNRLYKVEIEYNSEEFSEEFAEYIARLKMTAVQIKERYNTLKSKPVPIVDNKTSREVFEGEVKIPVKTEEDYDKSKLMAKHDIGLATDCPRDEDSYWKSQYHEIKKLFVRFLREPRRAVKAASQTEFRRKNSVTDERIFGLNENQLEDVRYKMDEEERAMVETRTSSIYDTESYMKKINEADKVIHKGIAQRMTRRKTVLIGVIVGCAYLFGFLPMLFGNTNTAKSFFVSLVITAIAVGVFMISGFIYLFFLRKKLVNRFKHFNYVMSGIYSEIQNSMERFSEYLSHACNVMRESSILDYAEKNETKESKACKALKSNLYDVEGVISDTYSLFSQFCDDDVLLSAQRNRKIKPFDYDFTACKKFEYPMFECEKFMSIEYMLAGHSVDIPVDYVKAVILNREELYD